MLHNMLLYTKESKANELNNINTTESLMLTRKQPWLIDNIRDISIFIF